MIFQDRSIPSYVDFAAGRAIKGRPLGLEALWLLKGSHSNDDCCIDKEEHHLSKKTLALAHFWQERKDARAALWLLRLEHPSIVRLFMIEAKVPDDLLGDMEQALWEPMIVF